MGSSSSKKSKKEKKPAKKLGYREAPAAEPAEGATTVNKDGVTSTADTAPVFPTDGPPLENTDPTNPMGYDMAYWVDFSNRIAAKEETRIVALFKKMDRDDSDTLDKQELKGLAGKLSDGTYDDAALLQFFDCKLPGAYAAGGTSTQVPDGVVDVREFGWFLADCAQALPADNAIGEVVAKCEALLVNWFPVLQLTNMNQQILQMQYAVRGEVPILANKIREELASGTGPARPFKEVMQCNIGNPQACGQKPVTYYRQVLALCDAPMLMEHPKVGELFPKDVVDRAAAITGTIKGGTGAYSHSQGIPSIRQNVADFIEARDGFPCNPADLFLTNGASAGLNMVFTIMMAHPDDAILVPIPQYPIYSALASMTGARLIGYYLDEAAGWTLTEAELNRALTEARKDGAKPKAMVVINPGNPTGQCMGEGDLQMIVKFCQRERLVLLADEVYQENVYAEAKSFVSLKKVVKGLGPDFDKFELISFHSTSKGIIGECGRRGGYMELLGLDKDVQAQLFKLSCTGLCSNIDGQIMTDLMVKGPEKGGESFELFQEECKGLFDDLKRKSANLVKALNEIDGLTCNPPEGALYAFVKFDLPDNVVAHCKTLGKSPDLLYCLSLLETEGICCVPGSGFGQVEGSWHFRTTFLPPEEQMVAMPAKIATHHQNFLAKMAGPQGKLDKIAEIKVSHPGNLAVKHFDLDYYNGLSDEEKPAFLQCVNTGIENADSGMGCYAMQPKDYDRFKPFFSKVLAEYHSVAEDAKHVTNWSLEGVEGLPEGGKLDLAALGLPELSMRVRVGRNLKDFPLPGAMTKDDRIAMEKKVVAAFEVLKADPKYGGGYNSLTEGHPDFITMDKYQELVDKHIMFKDMAADTYLASAGIASDWPFGRGCYVSGDEQFIIWVGEEDHLRIMCMKKASVLNEVFDRLKEALDVVNGIEGLEFASSEDYGKVTSCPTNLGTGMRASVHIPIPNLTSDGTDAKAKAICKPLGLSVRGTGGEHTPIGADGTCDISPSARFCITEAQIITALYNGLKLLKEEEGKAKPCE